MMGATVCVGVDGNLEVVRNCQLGGGASTRQARTKSGKMSKEISDRMKESVTDQCRDGRCNERQA